MAIITTGQAFTPTGPVTNTKLQDIASAATFNDPVDETSLELIPLGTNAGKLGIKDDGVTTDKVLDANITVAKIGGITDSLKVIGRTTAGAGAAEEVTINDDDDLSSASAITLATDESIKAYVDSLLQYQMKYSGSTGTISTTTSWADWDLSSFVGSNRALVIIELYDASNVNQLLLKTKGSQVSGGYVSGNVSGWGSSGICLSTTDQGGTVQVITDENGFVEVQAYTAGTDINYTIQAYQKLA